MGYGTIDKKAQKAIDKAKRLEKRQIRKEAKYGVPVKNKNQPEEQKTKNDQPKPYISINKPIRLEFWCFNCEQDFKEGCGSRDCLSNDCVQCTMCPECIKGEEESRKHEWQDYLNSAECREDDEFWAREEEEWRLEHDEDD
jgi:hypothetical protein